MKREERTAQLDAEILICAKREGKLTGYRLVQLIKAPEATIRYRLRRLTEMGKLDCNETWKSKVYSLPKEEQICEQ